MYVAETLGEPMLQGARLGEGLGDEEPISQTYGLGDADGTELLENEGISQTYGLGDADGTELLENEGTELLEKEGTEVMESEATEEILALAEGVWLEETLEEAEGEKLGSVGRDVIEGTELNDALGD